MAGADVDVLIEASGWAETGIEAWAQSATDATLHHIGLRPQDWSVAVLACDDARIADLNSEFREKPTPTNVLSWPSRERAVGGGLVPPSPAPNGDPELGDIAIAVGVTAREALDQNKTLEAHTTHLIVHAVLHLLGYDHIDDKDAALMERTERDILATLGLPDPY